MCKQDKKIVLLIDKIFEDAEALYPYFRLQEAGYQVALAGPVKDTVYNGKWGYPLKAELGFAELKSSEYEGVIVTGGYAPDLIRRYPQVLQLVKELFTQGKLVGAICHGPWVLISAKVLSDKQITCVAAIKDDVVNAGAIYLDQEVVVDGNIITSRNPYDLPAFMKAIINFLQKKS